MRTLVTLILIIICFSFSSAQNLGKSVFNQDFNNNVVENIVLKLPQNKWDKKYSGYTLFIYVSNNEEVEISYSDKSLSVEMIALDDEIKRNYMESLEDFDLSPYKGCLLVYPVLFIQRSSKDIEDNFREGIKNMIPLLKFEDYDCIQFQETLIGSSWRGI